MHAVKERVLALLRWSERYSTVDMVYLVRGGSWLSFGTFISMVSAFVLGLVAANYIDPEIYGVYKYVLSFVAILTMATLPGLDQAYIQAVARGREGGFFRLLQKKIVWGLLGSLGSLLCAAYYFINDNYVLTSAFVVVAAFIPFMDSLSLYDDLFQGRRAFALSSKFLVLSQIASTILLVATILYFPQVWALVLAFCAGLTVIRLIFLIYTLRTHAPNNAEDEGTTSYGMQLTVIRASSVIAGSIGGIIIFQVLGGTALAVYAFAVAPTELVRGWMNLMSTLLLPKFAQDSWSVLSFRDFLYKTRLFFGVLILGVGLYILLAPTLFETLFPQYIKSILYSQIYATTLLLTGAIVLFNVILRAKKQVRSLHIANIVSIAVHAALAAPLAYFFGIGGLVFAVLTGKLIDMIVQGYFTFWSTSLTVNARDNNGEENGSIVNT